MDVGVDMKSPVDVAHGLAVAMPSTILASQSFNNFNFFN